MGDRATASAADQHDQQRVFLSSLPSQLLFIEVLRRPLESTQYTSKAFTDRCRLLGVTRSMGSVGDAFDNAMAESFFATLKAELVDRCCFHTPEQARGELFDWIEGWYNTRRRHSSLGYHSPIAYEKVHRAAA